MEQRVTNATLIQKLKEGDEATFAYIYNKYHNAVFANICKLQKKPDDAEDILQEVFILLWNNRHKLTIEQEIGGWLFSTSYYKSLEHLKKSIRLSITALDDEMHHSIGTETDNSFEEEYAGRFAILNTAIEQLSPQKKIAFTLCRLQGKSYEEAATELGVSVETIKGYVKAAGKAIKNYVISNDLSVSMLCIYGLTAFL